VSSARRGRFKGGGPPSLGIEPGLEAWEATNLLTVATAVAASARQREESRGAHWRDDFGERREEWHGHLLVERDPDAGLRHHFVPAEGRIR
jgi:L-aspartate oxidase